MPRFRPVTLRPVRGRARGGTVWHPVAPCLRPGSRVPGVFVRGSRIIGLRGNKRLPSPAGEGEPARNGAAAGIGMEISLPDVPPISPSKWSNSYHLSMNRIIVRAIIVNTIIMTDVKVGLITSGWARAPSEIPPVGLLAPPQRKSLIPPKRLLPR